MKDMDLRARFFLANLERKKGKGRLLESFDYKNIAMETERDYRNFLIFSRWIGYDYESKVINNIEETLAILYPAEHEGTSRLFYYEKEECKV
jgi:hypothetical protein